MAGNELLTVEEAQAVIQSRGIEIDLDWLRKKARDGKIAGAQKIGGEYRGIWLIPREWAETYVKDTRGRPRKSKDVV